MSDWLAPGESSGVAETVVAIEIRHGLFVERLTRRFAVRAIASWDADPGWLAGQRITGAPMAED